MVRERVLRLTTPFADFQMPDASEDLLLTPTLIKAARALLNWDQVELAKQAGVSRKTISLIEAAAIPSSDPRRIAVLNDLRKMFEQKFGVQFAFAGAETGEGVKILRPRP
jgi:DNA-binding XRE family transcriptional regulator